VQKSGSNEVTMHWEQDNFSQNISHKVKLAKIPTSQVPIKICRKPTPMGRTQNTQGGKNYTALKTFFYSMKFSTL